jgi:hypothetical protein
MHIACGHEAGIKNRRIIASCLSISNQNPLCLHQEIDDTIDTASRERGNSQNFTFDGVSQAVGCARHDRPGGLDQARCLRADRFQGRNSQIK